METKNRKLVLYISCSLDGFIAKENDDLSFLSIVRKEGEDYGYADFVDTVDTVIVGRKTFDWVIAQGFEYPHNDKDVYVISRKKSGRQGNVIYYSGELGDLVNELKSKKGKNIYCDGGSEIANKLMHEWLIDELIISVIPIILGNGTPLFKYKDTERRLELISSKSYDSGLVQLHYHMKKS